MKRPALGFFALLLLTACDHQQPRQDDNRAAVDRNGKPIPVAKSTQKAPLRAKLVALPPAATPASLTNAAAMPPPSAPEPSPSGMPAPLLDATTNLTAMPAPVPDTTPPPAPDMAPTPPAPPPPKPMTEAEARRQVVVLETSFGRIVIQLDDVAAPRTCGNFRKLVSDGFYNHTIFHRVIPHFIIQGGDPNSKSDQRATYGQGDPGYTLPAEIGLHHAAGAVAMARLPDALNRNRDSNGSQFFICVGACPSLDGQYTVFGRVISGMDVVMKISEQPRDAHDDPNDRIEMQASFETKKEAVGDNEPQ